MKFTDQVKRIDLSSANFGTFAELYKLSTRTGSVSAVLLANSNVSPFPLQRLMACLPVSLDDVPRFVLRGVSAHLDFQDVLRCQQVCRSWWTVFQDADILTGLLGSLLIINLYKDATEKDACVSPADNQLLRIKLRTGRGPLTCHWEGSFCLWWRRHANTFLHLQLEVSDQDFQRLMDLMSSANTKRKSAASWRGSDTSDQDCHCAVDKLLSAFNNCRSAAPSRTLALQAGNTSQSPYRWIDSYNYMQQHTCDVITIALCSR